jgi:hypothetical protein
MTRKEQARAERLLVSLWNDVVQGWRPAFGLLGRQRRKPCGKDLRLRLRQARQRL